MAYATRPELEQWANLGTLTGAAATTADLVLEASANQVDGFTGRSFAVAAAEPSAALYEVRAGDTLVFVDDFVHAESLEVADADGAAVPDVEPLAVKSDRPFTIVRLNLQAATRGTWTITARWGWPATPDAVKLANLMLAFKLWQRQLSPSGIQGSADAGFIRVHGIDRDVEAILAPYVRLRGGFGR